MRTTSEVSTPSCTWRSSRTTRRPAQPGNHVRHQPPRICPPGASSRSAWGHALRLHLLLQRLRHRRRRTRRRALPDQPADRIRSVQDPRRARRRRDGRRRLLPHVPSQRDRLRGVAADALRHRAQQPLGPGLDDGRDPDGERRHALAALRAHPGHREVDRVHARSAARGRSRRDLQRRLPPTPTTRCGRSPRSWAPSFPAARVRSAGGGPTRRSYRVSFDKINAGLPGFACDWDAERGARAARRVPAHRLDEDDFTWRASRG